MNKTNITLLFLIILVVLLWKK